MVFGLFRKPKRRPVQSEFALMLSMDDRRYAEAILTFFTEMDPATRAHVLVAYPNLVPILSALYMHAKERGERYTVDDFVRNSAEQLPLLTDEVNSRRMAWFLFAALLARLEKLAHSSDDIRHLGGEVWCILVQEAPRLKVLLPNNIVWKDDEKVWFDLRKSDDEMVQNAINHDVPAIFAKTTPIKNLATARGLFYWPGTTRVGIVP